MLKEIQVYETADKKRFDDEGKAQEHVADAIRQALDKRLAPLVATGKFSHNDVYRIVMAIIPDADAAVSLHKHLAGWVAYGPLNRKGCHYPDCDCGIQGCGR